MKAIIVKDFKLKWIKYTASLKGISVQDVEKKYNSSYELDEAHREIAGKEVELDRDGLSGYSYIVKSIGFPIHFSHIKEVK